MNFKRSSLFILMALLLTFALVVSACQPAAEAPAEEVMEAEAPAEEAEEATDVFKLGILGPFSGPSARTGDEFKQSATMAFDAIEWQIGPYKIEPVWSTHNLTRLRPRRLTNRPLFKMAFRLACSTGTVL